MSTDSSGTPQPTHTRATGPVSELWLQQILLPRLTRRPYGTHRYFQQRMTADGARKGVATVVGPVPQSNPRRISRSEHQLSDYQEFCTNLNQRAFAKDDSTALHGYRKRLLDLTSESLERPLLQGTPELSGTTYVPLGLSASLSPGSTVENTEEEHQAAIELCLSSRSVSSVERRNDRFSYGCTHEYFDERSSKRICTTGLARKDSEGLGVVEATAIAFENHDEPDIVRSCESTSRRPRLSALHSEDHDYSHIDALPSFLTKLASAKAYYEESEQHGSDGNLPQFCPLSSVSGPVGSVVQTFASMPSSYMGKDTGEGKAGPMTSGQDLQNTPDSQCMNIKISQAIKCKGAFLGPHQVWCAVPGSWEDAVACSENMRMETAQK